MDPILSTVDWTRLQEVFDVTSELPLPERGAYLDALTDLSPELRARVEALLTSLDVETRIDSLVGAAAAHALEATMPIIGGYVGPYKILSVMGRGGMGIVYKAVRADDAYRKEVAIKMALSGLVTSELRQRFLHERQILANLDHPHIAHLMDGGTTAEGTPYVVMEFVSGRPINVWCDEGKLGRRERVQLILAVCRAVDYAHRHLVVHRDLKPDNIYVTAEGVPKLLDFGIAKALDPEAAGLNPSLTVDAARLLTPGYASPEQIRGKAITTGTDVYQLGVLLYQLLCGRRPFEITKERMAEMERIICEVPPPKPNLDDDLDRIILQALEKEPARRYASAGDLAGDLDRYLNGFPVAARSSTWSYYARKFVLRHKLAVASGVLVLLLLVSFSVAMVIQARRLSRERNSAQKVSDFLGAVFSAGNPAEARGKSMTARELLDQGAANIDRERNLDLVIKDRLLNTLGTAYRSQGIYDRAQVLFAESLQIRRSLYGDRSKEVAETMEIRTSLDFAQEHYAQADADAKEWITLTESLNGTNSQELVHVLNVLATMQFVHGDLAAAEASQRHAIQIAGTLHGTESPEVYRNFGLLGNILFYRGDFSEEEKTYRRELRFFEKGNWQDTPEVINIMDVGSKLGSVLGREGRYAEAEPLLRQMLALRLKIQGQQNDQTASTEVGLGMVLGKIGQTAEAERLDQQALQTEISQVGAGMNYGTYESELANLYMDEGKYGLAEPLLKDRVAICKKNLGDESLALARTLTDLGRLQTAEKQFSAASETLNSALAIEQKLNGDASLYAAADQTAVGRLQMAEGNLPVAEASLRHALDSYRTTAQSDLPGTAVALETLGTLLLQEHRNAEAKPLLLQAVTIRQVSLPADARLRLQAEALLAQSQR